MYELKSIQEIDFDEITALDMRDELETNPNQNAVAYNVIIRKVGEPEESQEAQGGTCLWFPDTNMAMVEFGADSEWVEADSPVDAINQVL